MREMTLPFSHDPDLARLSPPYLFTQSPWFPFCFLPILYSVVLFVTHDEISTWYGNTHISIVPYEEGLCYLCMSLVTTTAVMSISIMNVQIGAYGLSQKVPEEGKIVLVLH